MNMTTNEFAVFGAHQGESSTMSPSEGWFTDPSGRHELRLYDRNGPTSWVSDNGQAFEDPVTATDQVVPGPAYEPSPNDYGQQAGGTVTAPPVTAQSTRPIGWYRNAADPSDTKFWDGSQWLDQQPETLPSPANGLDQPQHVASPTTAVSNESEGWHADPLGRYKFRWLSAGAPTKFVSDDQGQLSFDEPIDSPSKSPGENGSSVEAPASARPVAPADWYPDPADPARLRYWDGTGWTTRLLEQTPKV